MQTNLNARTILKDTAFPMQILCIKKIVFKLDVSLGKI